MPRWTFVRENDGEYTVGKNGFFYNDIENSSVPNTVHAVQWNGTSGDLEVRDATTGNIVDNQPLSSLSDYGYIETMWNSARSSHKTDWTANVISNATALGVTVPTQSEADNLFETTFPVPSE